MYTNNELKWLQSLEVNNIHILLSKVVAQVASVSNVVLHYESDAGEIVDTIVKRASEIVSTSEESKNKLYSTHALAVLTINYDELNKSSKVYDMKGNKRRSAHLILLSDPLQFEIRNENITRHDDIVIYFYAKAHMKPNITNLLKENDTLHSKMFFKGNFIKEVHSMFVLEIEEDVLKLHDICYYCGKNSKKVILRAEHSTTAANSSDVVMLRTIKHIIMNRFRDMYGHQFRIAFAYVNVTLTCDRSREVSGEMETVTYCDDLDGVEGKLLFELKRKLNFTYLLVNPHHTEIGAWNNMIVDVNQSRVDWSMGGITISESRYKMVTFSSSFGNDPMRILFADRESLFAEGSKVISAFGFVIWLILGFTLITLTIVLYTWNKYFTTKEFVNFSESTWIISSILIEQSYSRLHAIGGRRLLVMWLLCCVIISTSYKGKLYALMVASPRPSIVKIEELVDQEYVALLHQGDATLMETMLQTSSDPTLVKLSKRIRADLEFCDGVKALLSNKIMLVEEQNVIIYSFNKDCVHRMSSEETSRVRLSSDTILPSSHGWPFRKKTPYLKVIDKYILRIYMTGLYDKWRENAMRSAGSQVLSSDGTVFSDTNNVFNIKSFFGLLILWFIGIFVSIFAFIFEIFAHKILVKKQDKKIKSKAKYVRQNFIH